MPLFQPVLRATVATLLLAPVLVAAGSGTAVAAPSSSAGHTRALEVRGPSSFSPNGDRRLDTARFAITVGQRATVKVRVVRDGRVVKGPVRLGDHRSGSTVRWIWDGRNDNGRHVRDANRYRVKVSATTRTGRVHRHEHWLTLDTVYRPERLVVNDDTVYPRTTVVHDRIGFGVRPNVATGSDDLGRGTLRITRPGGKVVFSSHTGAWDRNYPFTPPFPVAWDGRDNDGKRLPAGRYWARVRSTDGAGNTGATARIPVRVAADRLVELSGTVTVSPVGTAVPYNPCENSTANGCGDFPPCGSVVPSSAYADPGALSYRSSTGCSTNTFQHRAPGPHRLVLGPDTPRGAAVTRVSMRGRPTVSGETDTARLFVSDASAVSPVTTEESLTTATAPPVEPRELLWAEPRWGVSTFGEDSFDVATFTVDYSYLAPRG